MTGTKRIRWTVEMWRSESPIRERGSLRSSESPVGVESEPGGGGHFGCKSPGEGGWEVLMAVVIDESNALGEEADTRGNLINSLRAFPLPHPTQV